MPNGRSDDSTVTRGSANVFADLGVASPAEALFKSDLAMKIAEAIRENGWTQARAAKSMGVDQPKVSAILRGRLEGFTSDRLVRMLGQLGRSVRVVVERMPESPADPPTKRRTAKRPKRVARSA